MSRYMYIFMWDFHVICSNILWHVSSKLTWKTCYLLQYFMAYVIKLTWKTPLQIPNTQIRPMGSSRSMPDWYAPIRKSTLHWRMDTLVLYQLISYCPYTWGIPLFGLSEKRNTTLWVTPQSPPVLRSWSKSWKCAWFCGIDDHHLSNRLSIAWTRLV